MGCYITSTGRYLPGLSVNNDRIEDYLGSLPGELDVKRQVLTMNGIVGRHYAQDLQQRSTDNVYSMAAKAVDRCLEDVDSGAPISYLAAGSTYAPYAGPGLTSLIHPLVSRHHRLNHPVEIIKPFPARDGLPILVSAARIIALVISLPPLDGI